MKMCICLILLLFCYQYQGFAEEPKKEKPPVQALKPIPLDEVFKDPTTTKELNEALLNDPTFRKAVKAALEAKKRQEQAYKENPQLKGSSPAQAARTAFLRILQGDLDENGK